LVADGVLLPPIGQELERTEGLTFIHPFDSVATLQGTATAGMRLSRPIALALSAFFQVSVAI
jgi:threonine dehydratase